MKVLGLIAQLLLGLLFLVFGANFFFPFLPPALTPPPPTDDAKDFLVLLISSGYFAVVMGLEIAGGIALLTIRWANVGVLILGPILVNIWLYHGFLAKGGYEIPGLASVLFLIVIVRHWDEWKSALD